MAIGNVRFRTVPTKALSVVDQIENGYVKNLKTDYTRN